MEEHVQEVPVEVENVRDDRVAPDFESYLTNRLSPQEQEQFARDGARPLAVPSSALYHKFTTITAVPHQPALQRDRLHYPGDWGHDLGRYWHPWGTVCPGKC